MRFQIKAAQGYSNQMKQRRPKPRKPFFRQPRKQLPPAPPPRSMSTDTPPRPRQVSKAVLDPVGTSDTPLPLRDPADQAAFKAEVKEEVELRDTTDATVTRAAQYEEMLSRIAVLERFIAELPNQRGIGHNLPPIGDEDVPEITQVIVTLKAQPLAPDKAKAAQSTLKKIGKRLGTYVDAFLLEASKSAGKEFGKRVVQYSYWWGLYLSLMTVVQAVSNLLR
jgi:hypothetical protein